MKMAFIFPGQGSQFIGMGKELYDSFEEARHVFQEVDDALSAKLSKIIFEGPELDLKQTENTQPALMAVSMAAFRVLLKQSGLSLSQLAQVVAGHSLGEYSALCAAGSLDLSTTAKLLSIRGQAMQQAVPYGQGAMAAILGPDLATVQKIAQEAAQGQICQAANDNAPGQVVVSGDKEAVERAMELAKNAGAKRSILLPVSAPFHCDLMQPAAQAMKEALQDVDLKAPQIPLIANVTAQATQDPQMIKDLLVQQVTSSVRWRESVHYMAQEKGITHMCEIGAGKVLSGLVKRIEDQVQCTSCGTPAEIEAYLTQCLA